jgi:glycosyltransferase involved in cell wall biosynthesis
VTRFLAVSELVAEKASAAGVRDVAVSVTRNFPDDRAAATIPSTIGESPLRMLFAARLTEEKGTKLLLDALTLLPNENVRLVVVGSGPFEAEVERRSQSDPRVDFRGLVASDVVDQLIEESDLVLVPSRWFEADPLMIHQALSRGVPPLVLEKSAAARTLGTTPELVSGRTPAALAQSIVRLSEDRELLSDVAERATREYRASFAPVIDQIVGHYEELVLSA